MIIVRHRINTREALETVPPAHGVEIDLRSTGGQLCLEHDPFVAGEPFAEWLGSYRHRLLIVNVKEEGLEERALALLAGRGIEEFFFLDQSFPFLVRTVRAGERRTAVRVSEYESVETALALAGLAGWIWVDSFSRLALEGPQAAALRGAGYRLCFVSPELQGRTAESDTRLMRQTLASRGIEPDAVCTKRPQLWA